MNFANVTKIELPDGVAAKIEIPEGRIWALECNPVISNAVYNETFMNYSLNPYYMRNFSATISGIDQQLVHNLSFNYGYYENSTETGNSVFIKEGTLGTCSLSVGSNNTISATSSYINSYSSFKSKIIMASLEYLSLDGSIKTLSVEATKN